MMTPPATRDLERPAETAALRPVADEGRPVRRLDATVPAAVPARPAAAAHGAASRLLLPALVLPAILVLGVVLRLYGLGERPFWVDEAATLGIGQLGWGDFLRHVAWTEASPPAYYALANFWLDLGPAEEWWLRLPSALAGAAAVPLMYLFCRRAFGPRAALIGAALLAVAPAHVRFSQEARTYALFFLAVLGALLAAQALNAAETPRRRWALAALLAVLASLPIALHGTGVVAVAAVFVYAGATLLARGQILSLTRLAPLVAAGLGALVIATPWLLWAIAILDVPRPIIAWMPPVTVAEAFDRIKDVLLAPYLTRLAVPVAALQLGALAVVVALCRREAEFLGCLAALAFALLAFPVIALLIEHVLFERTLLFTLVFWIPLLAAGLGAIRRPAVAALALLLILAPQARSLAIHARMNHYEEYWDLLGERIAAAARPGEALVGIGVFEAVAARHYLRRAGGAELPLAAVGLGYEAPFLPMARAMLAPRAAWVRPGAAELCAALGTVPGLWIAGRGKAGADSRAALEPVLRQLDARPTGSWRIGSLRLTHWTAPERCPAVGG